MAANTTVVLVRKDMIGKLIGKRGSRIQEMQEKSHTKIEIVRNFEDMDGEYVSVIITGERQYRCKACFSLERCVGNIEVTFDDTKTPHISSWRDFEMDTNSPIYKHWIKNESNEIKALRAKNPSELNFAEGDLIENANDVIKLKMIPEIRKNFYIEHQSVTRMSKEEVESFRMENFDIKVSRPFGLNDEERNKRILNPVKTFEQAFFKFPEILTAIKQQNFTVPSPIQSQAWPVIMSGEDVIGIAQTGTGKTLAFVLPAFIHIVHQVTDRKDRSGPTVIVLAPTRELAIQIDVEIKKYAYQGIETVCVYGGVDRFEQLKLFEKARPEVVVGTPGRMWDFISSGKLNLQSVSYFVLDEADKMLDDGFEPDINRILSYVRTDRQCILTSATWPPAVSRLAQKFTKNPVMIVVGSMDLAAVNTVHQNVLIMEEDEKLERLKELIRSFPKTDKTIVFCSRKATVDFVSMELSTSKIPTESMSSNCDQYDREAVLQYMREGTIDVLVASDLVSRGIDLPNVTCVINYDFPKNVEDYVHRIGRTGRAGREGKSFTFFTYGDRRHASDLIKILEEANQDVPQDLRRFAESAANRPYIPGGRGRRGSGGRGYGGGFRGNRDYGSRYGGGPSAGF